MKNTKFDLLSSHGSYFICARYDRISNEGDRDFAIRITKEFGVATIPVSVFYKNGTDNNVVRFCFSKKKETFRCCCRKTRQNLMIKDPRYKGIFFMLLCGFGVFYHGWGRKIIKGKFHCGTIGFLSKCYWFSFSSSWLIHQAARSGRWKIIAACFPRLHGNNCSLYTFILRFTPSARHSDELQSYFSFIHCHFCFFSFWRVSWKKSCVCGGAWFCRNVTYLQTRNAFALVLSFCRFIIRNHFGHCLSDGKSFNQILRSENNCSVFS